MELKRKLIVGKIIYTLPKVGYYPYTQGLSSKDLGLPINALISINKIIISGPTDSRVAFIVGDEHKATLPPGEFSGVEIFLNIEALMYIQITHHNTNVTLYIDTSWELI
jgi:hypothetical protein